MALLPLLLSLLAFAGGSANPIEPPAHCEWPAEAIRLSAKEIRGRIRHKVEPKLDGSVCVKGAAVFRVLIDPEGNVECATSVRALPGVGDAALDAVKQFRFEPVVVEGRRVQAIGLVVVDCSWDRNLRGERSTLGVAPN